MSINQNLKTRNLKTRSTNRSRRSRAGKLIFVGAVSLSLLLAVLWGYFQLWNFPSPPRQITESRKNPVIPQWQLLFNDEFNETDRLDTQTKWNVQDTSDGYQSCCLTYGVQDFTPEALSFSQGALRIATEKRDVSGSTMYTSGAITTEDKFDFTYGRVDVRARLPETRGFWPAIWLLPTRSTGVAPFEIDIMEMFGQDSRTVHMTNHWGKAQASRSFTGPNFSQDYHLFSMIWTPRTISWYIDGVQRFETEQGISNQPMYLIINSSLGGRMVGNPDASTVFPQYMYIDYVRIYQPAAVW